MEQVDSIVLRFTADDVVGMAGIRGATVTLTKDLELGSNRSQPGLKIAPAHVPVGGVAALGANFLPRS
jgi:hypothetical protein